MPIFNLKAGTPFRQLHILFQTRTLAHLLHKVLASLIAATALFTLLPSAQAIELHSDSEVATAGYYRLSWDNADQAIELQEADNAQFNNAHRLYLGHDSATLISGKPNGQWFYRLRLQDEQSWSKPVVVTVQHHTLTRALAFLSLGLLVFAATITLIVHGSRQTRRQHHEQ